MYELTEASRPLLPAIISEPTKHRGAISEVVEYYRQFHPRSRAGKATAQKILERFNEGYTVQDLCDAIQGCHLSPFHQGQNDRQRKYLSLELIVRNAENVAQFLDIFDDAAQKHWHHVREREEKRADREAFRKHREQSQAKRRAKIER